MKNKDGSLNTENRSQTVAFIWSITDLLCGNFKQSKYSSVILPFTLLRRPECVLQPTGHKVLDPYQSQCRQDGFGARQAPAASH